MTEFLPGLTPAKPPKPPRVIKSREFKISVLRECTAENVMCEVAAQAVDYWRKAVVSSPNYNPDVESLVVLALNTRKRVIGHVVVATGTLDTIHIHPREVYKTAIALNAAGIILMHNHPSGDPSPSAADVQATRDMMRAGAVLKIELVDHVIVGHPTFGRGYASLKEMGHMYVT